MKVEPSPGVDATSSVPPCASTIARLSAKPSPDPGASGPRRTPSSKIRARSSRGMPGPASATAISTLSPDARELNRHEVGRARMCEGVRDEVVERLAEGARDRRPRRSSRRLPPRPRSPHSRKGLRRRRVRELRCRRAPRAPSQRRYPGRSARSPARQRARAARAPGAACRRPVCPRQPPRPQTAQRRGSEPRGRGMRVARGRGPKSLLLLSQSPQRPARRVGENRVFVVDISRDAGRELPDFPRCRLRRGRCVGASARRFGERRADPTRRRGRRRLGRASPAGTRPHARRLRSHRDAVSRYRDSTDTPPGRCRSRRPSHRARVR